MLLRRPHYCLEEIFPKLIIVILTIVLAIAKSQEYDRNIQSSNLLEIIKDLNEEYYIVLNLAIDLNCSSASRDNEFIEMFAEIQIPRIVITQVPTRRPMQALYLNYNSNILTIACLNSANLNSTLDLLDELLWQIHFTNIILYIEEGNNSQSKRSGLLRIFAEASKYGFTSLMVLWHNEIYTYNPFIANNIQYLPNYTYFKDISRLENFQLYEFRTADQDYPPRCFRYRNRYGQLIRSGYFYKLVEHFVQFHNGTMRHEYFDLWGVEEFRGMEGFDFIPTQIQKVGDVASSDTFYFTKYLMIVPTAGEIEESLWLVAPFSRQMWLGIIFSTFLMWILFTLYYHQTLGGGFELSDTFLQSVSVLLYTGIKPLDGRREKFLYNFSLSLLFLFTGFFLTNLYSCNLCSIYTTRIREPEILTVEQISRTNLNIFLHSAEISLFLNLENLPEVFYKRCITRENNTELHVERLVLNMSSLYIAREDVVDMLLFQQLYMKRPRARVIPDTILASHLWIPVPQRSKIIQQLNRYLRYARDSGLLQKFMSDSQWDAYLSGTITFFLDDELDRSLKVLYFKYAFIIWFLGLLCASLALLWELLHKKNFK